MMKQNRLPQQNRLMQQNRLIKCCKIITALGFMVFLFTGCTVTKVKTEKLQDIDYVIVPEDECPEELVELIQENKSTYMKLSYYDQDKQYIIIGYGEQKVSGYSVEVREVYETENALYVDTNLLGPSEEEETLEADTYPYIILCIDENEKPIIYD